MYLVKLVEKEEYAECLMDGKLFMHTGYYYHELEKKYGSGQGDIAEGSIFPGLCIYKNSHFPIYCMTLIENESTNPEIRIKNKVMLASGEISHLSSGDFSQ